MDTSSAQLPNDKKPKSGVGLIIGVIAGIIVGSGGMFLISQSANKTVPGLVISSPSSSSTASPSTSSTPNNLATTSTVTQAPVKLADLKLFISERADEPYFVPPIVTYYQVGTIGEGKYVGYKKILALYSPTDPSGPQFFTFATQDDQHFVLDTNPEASIYFSVEGLNNSYEDMDKRKVTVLDTLPVSHPLTVFLDDNFSLYKGEPYYSYEQFQSDQDTLSRLVLTPKNKIISQLPAPTTSLTFFSLPDDNEPTVAHDSLKQIYGAMRSTVIGIDHSGLAYTYHLGSTKNIQNFPAQKRQYDEYYENLNQAGDDKATVPPEYVHDPNLHFARKDIGVIATIYDHYDTPFIAGCSIETDALVMQNIKETDLVQVASLNNIEIFALKDQNHELILASYEDKVQNVEMQMFKDYNNQTAKPTLSAYATKHPLLFMRDFWGRLIMMQENEYAVPQECGKPVIYLYPEKPTQVSLQFQSTIDFSTTIPSYHNGWKVMAQPDGTLMDLQPDFTNCAKIDVAYVGSEYATKACQENQYPYLYWSGKVLNKSYPVLSQGWVIAQANLADFMNDTLAEIGFTTKEKTDMLEYWLPTMRKKNSPYYRISFLQTAEMNALVPMHISPKPNTVYRLFLDWSPLENNMLELKPQQLDHIDREGFTMVEWGGLKR